MSYSEEKDNPPRQTAPESLVLEQVQARKQDFQPNPQLDGLIEQLQQLLVPAQQRVNTQYTTPRLPVIGLVGSPRSGITFASQLLAASGAVSWPSNLLSRFAHMPYLGALIQELLFNPAFDLGDEFAELHHAPQMRSRLGKTQGPLGVSEFFHFWRRFMPHHEPERLTPAQLQQVNIDELRRELAGIEAAFGKPFMSKAKMLQFNLDYFMQALPELRIIHIQRTPEHVMPSILKARRAYYQDERLWWSVKPAEYEELKNQDPITQIAGQVYYTDRSISRQLANIAPERWVKLDYEELCADPHGCLQHLARHFQIPGLAQNLGAIATSFPCGNALQGNEEEQLLAARYRAIAAADAARATMA